MKKLLLLLLFAPLMALAQPTPAGGAPAASQAEVNAGTVPNKYVSPLTLAGKTGLGSVTSVSFTGGIISVGTPATTPSFTLAGTSGGIVYFSDATHWASSALLSTNALMVGGGAGTAPSTPSSGTTLDSNGILTLPGSTIRAPVAITITANAGPLDITLGSSIATNNANTTINMSALGSSGQRVLLYAVNSDASNLHTWTINNVSGTDPTFTAAANATTVIALQSDGTGFSIVGGPPTIIDLSANTTPASTDVIAAQNTTTGATSKSTIGQVVSAAKADQIGSPTYAADAGSTDDYAITLTPAITAYVTGTQYRFKANTANTGAATLNVNGLGAKTIVKYAGGANTTLADNDIRAGQNVICSYDGTNMQMQSTLGNAASTSGWTVITKPTDQTIFNDNTLTNDTALTFAMTANTVYAIHLVVFFDTTAAGDFRYSVSTPASPTLFRIRYIDAAAGATPGGHVIQTSALGTISLTGSGTTGGYVELTYTFQNGANAGNWTFKWAQDTATNDTGAIVRAGSYLEYK